MACRPVGTRAFAAARARARGGRRHAAASASRGGPSPAPTPAALRVVLVDAPSPIPTANATAAAAARDDRALALADDAEYRVQSRRAFVAGAGGAALAGGCALCAAGGDGRRRCFAAAMRGGMADYEALPEVRRFKAALFREVALGDRVLKIGIGSAPNVRYYADRVDQLLALEPRREFDEFILESVAAADLREKADIVPGVAERIPLPAASVDVVRGVGPASDVILQGSVWGPRSRLPTRCGALVLRFFPDAQVIGTVVLCSVDSVRRSLAEIRRVLKPGGRYLFVEHVAAPRDRTLLTMAQVLADPLQRALAEGCHLRRDPEGRLRRAFGEDGDDVRAERFVLAGAAGGGRRLPPHFLLAPHLVGVATKAA